MQDDAEPKRVHGRQPRADRDALRDAIAQEECLLAKLEAKQTESRYRLTVLRAELAALDTEPEIRVRLHVSPRALTPRTSADKVRLFRSLFRGREDIYQVLPFFRAPAFQQDGAGLGPAGVSAIIDNQLANAATTVEQGVRVEGQYTVDIGVLGRWKLSFSSNYLLVDRTSIEAYFPQATNVTNTIGEPPKFRLRGGMTRQYRNLTTDLMLNHTSAYQNTLFSPAQDIASWTTEDLA
jgi:hypothetical protein